MPSHVFMTERCIARLVNWGPFIDDNAFGQSGDFCRLFVSAPRDDGRVDEIEDRVESLRLRLRSSRDSRRRVPEEVRAEARRVREGRACIGRALQVDREHPRAQAGHADAMVPRRARAEEVRSRRDEARGADVLQQMRKSGMIRPARESTCQSGDHPWRAWKD
jgi:hypothetical protein